MDIALICRIPLGHTLVFRLCKPRLDAHRRPVQHKSCYL